MSLIEKIFGKKCENCNKERTKTIYEEKYLCEDCQLKAKMEKEEKVKCPKCSELLKKEIIEGVVIDRCQCGIWLDKGELEKLNEMVKSHSSSAMPFMMGMTMGSMMSSHR